MPAIWTAGSRRSAATTTRSPPPDSPTGWVYIVANNFDRSGPVRLFRVPPKEFTDRAKWQGWSAFQGWSQRADTVVG